MDPEALAVRCPLRSSFAVAVSTVSCGALDRLASRTDNPVTYSAFRALRIIGLSRGSSRREYGKCDGTPLWRDRNETARGAATL